MLICVLSTAQPYLSKLIIDQGLIARRFTFLVWLCGAVVALAASGFLLGAVNRWQYVRMSGRILFSMREAVYAHLLRLSPEFFRERPVGDLVTRLDGDVAEIQRFSTDTLLAFINGVFLLIATGAIMAALSLQLTLVAVCVLPFQLLLRFKARRFVTETTRSVREQAGRITHFLVETLGAVKAVQAAAAEQWEGRRLAELNRGFLKRLVSQQLVGYWVGGASGLLGHTTTAAVFIAGGYQVLHGSLTVGTLVAFTAYLTRSTGSAVSLMNLYSAYQRATVSLQRVRELLDAAPAPQSSSPQRSLDHQAKGHLRFERVSFSRAATTSALIDGLSFEITPGSKIVIHGESGVGKSTLVDLLRRFAEPDAGQIMLDGRNLRDYEIGSLRRRIVVLESAPTVFRASILYNLRYGNFDASRAAVLDVSQRAGVDAFVATLPQGYDTELGSGGIGLSTGQRQRIAVARTLLGDPLIVVLDEATSNLDAAAACSMHALIDDHFVHRTRLVITHAPRLVPGAGQVLELRHGRLRRTDRGLIGA